MHMCVCVWGRHRRDPAVWRPLCNAWDSALQMLSRARGVTPLSFSALMEGHVAHQLLKPVRARWGPHATLLKSPHFSDVCFKESVWNCFGHLSFCIFFMRLNITFSPMRLGLAVKGRNLWSYIFVA